MFFFLFYFSKPIKSLNLTWCRCLCFRRRTKTINTHGRSPRHWNKRTRRWIVTVTCLAASRARGLSRPLRSLQRRNMTQQKKSSWCRLTFSCDLRCSSSSSRMSVQNRRDSVKSPFLQNGANHLWIYDELLKIIIRNDEQPYVNPQINNVCVHSPGIISHGPMLNWNQTLSLAIPFWTFTCIVTSHSVAPGAPRSRGLVNVPR